MFINLRQYLVDNEEQKLKETREKDLELWEQLDDSDIIDLAFTRAQRLEMICIIILCLSAFLIGLGFLSFFHLIDLEKLVQTLQQVAL